MRSYVEAKDASGIDRVKPASTSGRTVLAVIASELVKKVCRRNQRRTLAMRGVQPQQASDGHRTNH